MRRQNLKVWGLTGGIASGKSEVAQLLRKHGVEVINLDTVGRGLLEKSRVVQQAVAHIAGHHVLTATGIDRAKIRAAVFAKPEMRRAMEVLLHPIIIGEFEKLAEKADQAGKKLLICEAALLVETGYYRKLDGLIVVTAPLEVRRERARVRDDFPPELVQAMIDAQLPDSEKTKVATFTIKNEGSLEGLEASLQPILERWKKTGLL